MTSLTSHRLSLLEDYIAVKKMLILNFGENFPEKKRNELEKEIEEGSKLVDKYKKEEEE
jgi:hypothetical protein